MTDRSDAIRELLVALIQNRCVNDGTPGSGEEARSVETIQAFMGAPGEVFEPAPGRRSVLYRVSGTDPAAPSLMLMGHTDVVPVTEAGWSVDPFAGEILDDFVWGRGAVDMLNLTAAMASVVRSHLRGERPRLRGDLLYLAVADEEAGGAWGARWLLEEHPDVVRADYLLTEVAHPPIPGGDGELVYPVKVGEKGPFWRTVTNRGTPSHGSQPYQTDNALVPIAEAIAALVTHPSPAAIVPEWEAFVRGLGLSAAETAALIDADLVDEAIEHMADTDLAMARYAHACTHLTISPNVASAGTKMNTVPDHAEVQLDIRGLPGHDAGTVTSHLRKVWGSDLDRFDVHAELDHPASSSPTEGPLWEAIGDGIESMTGSRRVVPALTPATTDARFFRTLGTQAYGVGMFDRADEFSTFLSMFHGNDERVSVASLGATATLFERIIERFSDHVAR
jgi:acetylornithine deacetylase/succinyl-diaminopimelate desuccinylase-like protein